MKTDIDATRIYINLRTYLTRYVWLLCGLVGILDRATTFYVAMSWGAFIRMDVLKSMK